MANYHKALHRWAVRSTIKSKWLFKAIDDHDSSKYYLTTSEDDADALGVGLREYLGIISTMQTDIAEAAANQDSNLDDLEAELTSFVLCAFQVMHNAGIEIGETRTIKRAVKNFETILLRRNDNDEKNF